MGAPQSRLYETAKGLITLGWKVKVITSLPNYPTGKIFKTYGSKFSVRESQDDIEVSRYWLYASNSKKAIPRIVSMLSFSITCLFSFYQIRKFEPDYIVTESPPLTLAFSGLILTKLSKAKHIMNISDIWPLSAFELGVISKGRIYRMLESLEKFLYKKSFACTGQSQQIVDHVLASGAKRVHLYRNGVNIDRFKNILLANKKNNQLPRIVYAGLLGVAQGICEICQNINFADLEIEFHIYGDGAERQQIEKFLTDNTSRGIILHKPLNRDAVPDMLSQFDFTIIPLVKPIIGAIPSKIYEAMAAGVPIIFAGGGEGSEIVEQYQVGWVSTPSDYPQMIKIITCIKKLDKNELAEIKNNCYYAAKNIFNRQIQIQLLDEFLTQKLI